MSTRIKEDGLVEVQEFDFGNRPKKALNEIVRSALVKNIYETFQNYSTINIFGGELSGKTTLLSQFVEEYEKNTFYYFIGTNFWHANEEDFLLQMCKQLISSMAKDPAIKITNEQIENSDLKTLKTYFGRLFRRLCHLAKKYDEKYFFVVDGIHNLSNIHGNETNSILKLLPTGESDSNIHVLISSRENITFPAETLNVPLQTFSEFEVEKFFSDILTKKDDELIKKICKSSNGNPGYLKEIRQWLTGSEHKIHDLLENDCFPSNLKELLEKIWNKVRLEEVDQDILCVLAVYSDPLEMTEILEILAVDSQAVCMAKNRIMPFLAIDLMYSNSLVISEPYKKIVLEQLITRLEPIYDTIIKYLEKKPTSKAAAVKLPQLYEKTGNIDKLLKYLSNDNLVRILQETKNLSLIRSNLRLTSDRLRDEQQWPQLALNLLIDSTFINMSSNVSVLESEINALLSLELYEESVSKALVCLLPEERLKLLAHICYEMQISNKVIEPYIFDAINENINMFDVSVGLSPSMINQLLDICAKLFTLKPDLVINMLRHIFKYNEQISKNNLIDTLATHLAVRESFTDEDIDWLKQQFDGVEPSSQETFLASPKTLTHTKLDEIFAEVDKISDLSAKIHLLRAWCLSNRKDPSAYMATEKAFLLMKTASNYVPPHLHLRDFAISLHHCEDFSIVQKNIIELDNLREATPPNPFEQYIHLELELALIEQRFNKESSELRFIKAYSEGTAGTIEENTKCLILVRLLIYSQKILQDNSVHQSLLKELEESFDFLLKNSADHYKITKKIISLIVKYNYKIAPKFIQKINRATCRERSYADILFAYISQTSEKYDSDFIVRILNEISNVDFQDWVFVKILCKIQKTNMLDSDFREILSVRAQRITSQIGRAFAITYTLNWKNQSEQENLFNQVEESINNIDSCWERFRASYHVVTILAKWNKKKAHDFLSVTQKRMEKEFFADQRLGRIYFETCVTTIRTLFALKKSKLFAANFNLVLSAIEAIPCYLSRCELYTRLGVECVSLEDNSYMEKCCDLIEKLISDSEHRPFILESLVVESSPLLYKKEGLHFIKKRNASLSYEAREYAFFRISRYLVSNKNPSDCDDIDDTDDMQCKIDATTAYNICEILKEMRSDINIASTIKILVAAITQPKQKKWSCSIDEKNVLYILQNLSDVITKQLPESGNHDHNGYQILSYIRLLKILKCFESSRLRDQIAKYCKTFSEIKNDIKSLPNDADKIYLLCELSSEIYKIYPTETDGLLKYADSLLLNLNNGIDRVERNFMLANTYAEILNESVAHQYYKQALDLAKLCSPQEGREQMMRMIIENVHNIDSTLSASLASKIDNPFDAHLLSNELNALSLKSDPSKIRIETVKSINDNYVIAGAVNKLFRSFIKGRMSPQTPETMGKWLYHCIGQDLKTANLAVGWYIESSKLSLYETSDFEEMAPLFSGLIQLLDTHLKIFNLSYDSVQINPALTLLSPSEENKNIQAFDIGNEGKDLALRAIISELSCKKIKKVTIYDPYFSEEYFDVIKALSQDILITIILKIKPAKVDEKLKEFQNYWKSICDQKPQINFHIFVTEDGMTSPHHDRWIVTDTVALSLGTSLNGFGCRESHIQYLYDDERAYIENDVINKLLSSPPKEINGKRLLHITRQW